VDRPSEIVLPPQEAAELDTCQRLLARVPPALETDDPGRVQSLTLLLVFCYRAKKTYQAVLILCQRGLGDQALMLCRSLFEDMVDAHWVHANPDTALERYTDHATLTNLKSARRVEKYGDLLGEELRDQLREATASIDEEVEARLRQLYGQYGTGSWTGLSLHAASMP